MVSIPYYDPLTILYHDIQNAVIFSCMKIMPNLSPSHVLHLYLHF